VFGFAAQDGEVFRFDPALSPQFHKIGKRYTIEGFRRAERLRLWFFDDPSPVSLG
jgi:hypothetical protein